MKNRIACAMICLGAVVMMGCGRSPETAAPPTDAPATPSSSSSSKPTHATYALQWVSHDVPATMSVGTPVTATVNVKNTGDWVWNHPAAANPSKPDGSYAVRLSYSWVGADGQPLPAAPVRGELAAPVPPGETANIKVKIDPPTVAGNYQLQFDLVEELVSFFSAKGNEKLTVPVMVQ